MSSANQCRYFPGSSHRSGEHRLLACSSRQLAANRWVFSHWIRLRSLRHAKGAFGQRPNAAGWQPALPRRCARVVEKSLRAFFEGGGLAAQVRERFAGEMKRTGEKNAMRSFARLIEDVGDRWSNGVGE
jgi:hypothetical protein